MQDHQTGLPSDASPEEVVRAATDALEAERWADVVPLVDGAALEQFRSSRLEGFRHMLRRAPRTAEEIQAEQPWLPLEVAAHEAKEERTRIERGRPQLLREWGVQDPAELEPLTPEEFFIRFLPASSPSAKLRQAWAVSHTPVADPAAEVARHPPQVRRQVLGSVVEADRYAHVLFREFHGDDDQGVDPGWVRFTTLDRTPAGWRLRIDGDLLAQQGWMRVYRPEPEEGPESGNE